MHYFIFVQQQVQVDTLAELYRLVQEHLRNDAVQSRVMAGQTKYDSTVMIAAISMIGTVITAFVGLIANIFSKKIGRLQHETTGQTGKLDDITTKVNGQLTRALEEISRLEEALARATKAQEHR